VASVRDYTVTTSKGPAFTVSAKVLGPDPATGDVRVIADLTGRDAIQFPAVLQTLTPEQFDRVRDTIAMMLVEMKAGLA